MGASRADVALDLLRARRGADSGLGIDDYQHALQTATRAERAGADDELIVAALLHDVGKALTPWAHDKVAGELLAGAVRPEVSWMVSVHQDLTSEVFRNGRGAVRRYRHVVDRRYPLLKRFVEEWDLPSRDPSYDTLPLEHFEPMVRDVLGRAVRRTARQPKRPLVRSWRMVVARLPAPAAERLDRSTADLRRRLKP